MPHLKRRKTAWPWFYAVWVAPLACGLLADATARPARAEAAPELRWPEESTVTRPWTFWHWMGNVVDKEHLAEELDQLNACGLGGVLVVQIQDVKDPAAVRVPFLSEAWTDIMRFTVREARRRGMDVDMCPTTGWEWGGPSVALEDSGARIDYASFTVDDGAACERKLYSRRGDLLAVMGYAGDGSKTNLMAQVGGDGTLQWTAPAGRGPWTVYTASLGRGACRVRFPTPDGDGWVADYLSAPAMSKFLDRIDTAMAGFRKDEWPRAWYDDSWEAKMSWTAAGFDAFLRRRGYDLRDHLPEIATPGLGDLAGEQWPPGDYIPRVRPSAPGEKAWRVARDFRLTVGEMMLDGFFKTAGEWARKHGSLLSCETIDHPGNIVDMATVSDIPFADVGGGPGWWYADGRYNTGKNFWSRFKAQASAAHIMGRPLVASETMTCWALEGEGELVGPSFFRIPLKDIKEKIDLDLVGGVNHTMYHSITYSPPSVRWPGYLFQAGTQMGPYNPYWPHFTELNRYVSRCQAFMQTGSPDVDLLFYYPCDDLYMTGRNNNIVFGAEQRLYDAGYDADYVTDRMLKDPKTVRVSRRCLVTPGSVYKALVVGSCRYMETETLRRIFDLARAGATVVIVEKFPEDVPGFFRFEERRAELKALVGQFEAASKTADGVARMAIGKGEILLGGDIHALMKAAGVRREGMTDQGLFCARRRDRQGWIYFIANPPGGRAVNGWVPIGVPGVSAALFDAATGEAGMASVTNDNGQFKVYMQVEPSGSRILRVFDRKVKGRAWTYRRADAEAVPMAGAWRVEFLDGGEVLPVPERVTSLSSWTRWTQSPQFERLKYFSGRARYSLTFDAPAMEAEAWMLDLGEVKDSARITLNGVVLGTVYGAPDYRVKVQGPLQPTGNVLEVEVANLAANRVAGLDIAKVKWNLVPTLYGIMPKADANYVPLDSGLIGPVKLIPVRTGIQAP